MPAFPRDGICFNYLDEGDSSGLPFIFQHGLGGDVSQPAGVFSPPEGVRLVSIDCRGHGQTRPLGDPEKLAFSCFADDVVVFMERLEISDAVVGGSQWAPAWPSASSPVIQRGREDSCSRARPGSMVPCPRRT